MPDIRVQDEQGKVHVFPDGSTPEMIAKAMGVKPPQATVASQQSAPVKSTGILSKLNDWWTRPSKDVAPADIPGVEQELGTESSPRQTFQKGMLASLPVAAPAMAVGVATAPAATLLGLGTGLAGGYLGSKAGEYLGEKVGAPELGSDIGSVGGALAGGVYGPKVRSAIRSAAYTPEGVVKPSISSAAQALRHPTEIPGRAVSGLLGKVFGPPTPPAEFPGASLPSADEFYSNEAAARMKLNSQQAALDRATARTATQQAKIPNWETPTHDVSELGSQEYPGPFSSLSNRLPASLRGDPFAPKPTSVPQIVPPSVGEPRFTGSEGRAATWTNEDVMRLAQQGNREAIQQAIRRGFNLPPGARYVMGDPDFSRTVYNPRESTTFTPEGQPIRNVENPTTPAPRARIAVSTQQTPREVTNAATGEVTNPYAPPQEQALEAESELERLRRNPPKKVKR